MLEKKKGSAGGLRQWGGGGEPVHFTGDLRTGDREKELFAERDGKWNSSMGGTRHADMAPQR